MLNFRSQITKKVLGFFFLNPDAENYINELARILKVDLGNLARKLRELEAEGIIASEMKGNQHFYFLNKSYPLLNEARRFFEVKYGLVEELKLRLSRLKGIEAAYIFGSYAKGRLGEGSDIDLLLVGSHSSLDAKRAISDLQNRYQREFNIVDMTAEEFERRKSEKDEFVANIFQSEVVRII